MYKKLFRSRRNKVIGGVAGGIAEYFDIDPVLVRAGFVLSTFVWGISLIIYIVMWIIVPVNLNEADNISEVNPEDDPNLMNISYERNKHNGRIIAGIFIIIFGFMALMHNFVPDFNFRYIWPIILIAIGIIIIYKSINHKDKEVLDEK